MLKFAKKIKPFTPDQVDDLHDVIAELEAANLLLINPDFYIEYESYAGGGPDFKVNSKSEYFNVEVKRIRQSKEMTLFFKCWHQIIDSLYKIPSQLLFALNCHDLTLDKKFPPYFESKIYQVITECESIVNKCKIDLKNGAARDHALKTMPCLNLRVVHIPEKQGDQPTKQFSSSYPIIFNRNETLKLKDVLFEKLNQFSIGAPNVLLVISNNIAQNEKNIMLTWGEIEDEIENGNKSFFKGKNFKESGTDNISTYINKIKALSAVVVITGRTKTCRSEPKNYLFKNPSSIFRLSKDTEDYLERM